MRFFMKMRAELTAVALVCVLVVTTFPPGAVYAQSARDDNPVIDDFSGDDFGIADTDDLLERQRQRRQQRQAQEQQGPGDEGGSVFIPRELDPAANESNR
ncbi:MAG: hypothetical protein AAFX39_13785 [Pseudomonadota bacterium]